MARKRERLQEEQDRLWAKESVGRERSVERDAEPLSRVWLRRRDQREFLLEREGVWYIRARDDSGVWRLPDCYHHGMRFYQALGKAPHDLVVWVGRRFHEEEQCDDPSCEYDHSHHVHATFLPIAWDDIRPANAAVQLPKAGLELD